ncbi:MAG: FAD binding domain-containing protein [Acidimicrobiales bacterium]
MKPVQFEYHRPDTVAEAVAMLDSLDDVKVIAGGQSLVPLMNFRLAAPANLVDVSRLGDLQRIDVTPEAVVVGAAATHSELLDHDGAAAAIPLLRHAERLIAHEVIRNRGTVCGSLAHADPSGEMTAVLTLLDGAVTARSVAGDRVIAAADLFVGPLQSSLQENELLIDASFPRPSVSTTTAIREVARRHGDYAVCGVAAAVDRAASGEIAGARAAFISLSPTPLVVDLGEIVGGRTPAEIDRGEVYDFVVERVDPADDVHATAEYRRHLAGVLAGDVVTDALLTNPVPTDPVVTDPVPTDPV